MSHQILRLLSLAVACLYVTGCQHYGKQSSKAIGHWNSGQIDLAVAEFGKQAEKNHDTKDHVVWHLEHATALRANDQIVDSTLAFEKAEVKIDEYEAKAEVSISREAGATMSNQANLPYRGRAYDKIMLNTFKALNYWEQGEYEKVRTEIFRAYRRQQDAVEENKKAIEKAQQEEKESKEAEKIEKAREDEQFAATLDGMDQSLAHLKPYGDYVNPFTVFVDGLFFQHQPADRADLERARKSFENLKTFSPENTYVESEIARIEQKMEGASLEPTTYVIFETGSAPSRDQIRIDIPIIIAKVSYVGAAFPKLKFHDNFHRHLKVQAGGQTAETLIVASMDTIVGNAFRKELPVIITKTMISTIVKAAAAYAINEGVGDGIAGLISKIGTAVAQAAVNIADLRTWTTLPKEFQYCRVATPADGNIRVSTPDGLHTVDVPVLEGTSNIIYVRSVNQTSPIIVNQFNLL